MNSIIQTVKQNQNRGSVPVPLWHRIISLFSKENKKKKTLIVLGTGWGAFRLLKSVDTKEYRVLVVSPRNHFLFTPLLAITTVGTLEFRSISESIRSTRRNVEYYQAECRDIIPETKTIKVKGVLHEKPFEMKYDKLLIAVGAQNNTFNIPGVLDHAYFLKELPDARRIRRRILECFEEAALPDTTDSERRRLLNFVIVGGGPTGIEFAGELNDFFWEDLTKAFPNIPAHEVRITVLEASNKILSAFDGRLVDYTMRSFRKRGIDLRTGSLVKEVKQGEVLLQDGTRILCGLIVWSTGVAPRPFIKELTNLPKDEFGRIMVNDHLKVKDTEDVYAVGDCSAVEGHRYPATAQVAQQQAAYLAKSLNSEVKGKDVQPFVFHNLGMMAYIGGYSSILDTPAIKGSGLVAWMSWRSAYLTRLGSIKSKIQVPFEWARTFLFGRDVSTF
eukprot:TRINITY_DN6232_c0_g2_i1.p1 TRINITY_DN6232_c0_g2~~TRINITY_DN6232_c0_g2_i1.p1  ORF type:complete len:467 (+),score=106.10 TRINITY_DN6232_c0_g2_i1:69-1403(+)